ncbi:MAG: tetratricopeptide repeat protein [Spirochaetaceae bacterium]
MALNHGDPEYQEAMRFYLSGQWAEAEKAFAGLKETYSDNTFIYLVLGNIHYSLGNLDTAVELYDEALRIDPKYGVAYYKKGVCLYRMGQLQEALASFEKIVELKGQSHAMANYFVGLINLFLGNDKTAEKAFASFRDVSPESHIADFYLAQLKIKQKKFGEALDLLKELAEQTPNFAEVHYMLGAAHYGLHNNTEAINAFRRSVDLNPDDERARNKLMLLTEVQWP